MKEKNQLGNVRIERNILVQTENSPFVVKLFYTFQSKNNFYFVMEYLHGGDCFSLLQKLVCFPERLARQYIAESVLALEYLHSRGIIHRDLKPDNMLITKDGHIKLTDFGLSKMGFLDKEDERESNKNEKVGTPDYLAPEIFLGMGHGNEVDWWALGCITYEFLFGVTPFYGDSYKEIFENTLNHQIAWPDGANPTARDFIEKLLIIDPKNRLGANSDGSKEVKGHPWFCEIDWDLLLKKNGMFVPRIKQRDDTQYFEPRQEIYSTEWEGDTSGDVTFDSESDLDLNRFSFISVSNLEKLNEEIINEEVEEGTD